MHGALLLLALLGSPKASEPPPLEFDPDTRTEQPVGLEGQTWTLASEHHAIQLRRLTDPERRNFIGQKTGFDIDPFLGPPDEAPRFYSFLLRIQNRGTSSLQFNPVHCWLRTNRQQILYPLGIADAMSRYHEGGMELPMAYERVAPALLEAARSIAPGEEVVGLLVYTAVEDSTRSFTVEVDLTRENGDVLSFKAPYLKRKPPKPEKGG